MKGRTENTTHDPSRALYEIERFTAAGHFDLIEDDRFVLTVAPACSSAEVSYGKLIFSCWGEGWSRSWRVESCETQDYCLRLQCYKRMGLLRCAVELRHSEAKVTSASRAEFTSKLPALIESALDLRVEHAVTARDDRLHFSGIHARLLLRDKNRAIAAVAVGASESQADIDAALGAGLVWLDHLRRRASVDQLMVFAPRGKALTLATRMTALTSGARVSLYEIDEATSSIAPVAAFDQGDLADNLRRAMWPRERDLDAATRALVASIIHLAPDAIEIRQRAGSVLFSIRGLEFARVSIKQGRAWFGLGESKKKLDESSSAELSALVEEIISDRRADSSDRNAPVFRAQSERWLEAIIRRGATVVDPAIDPRHVYSQVPAYRGEQRTFIDLLAATRKGRLVVMELKVAEDSEFPFQGLDYWLRVEWHRLRGDFYRRGYFEGVKLSDEPPLLYLVAPLFRFHATTKLIAGWIDARVPVYRIGINEDWRAGVRVLLNERLNSC